MIICPDQNRLTYVKVAKQHLPTAMGSDEAYRTYICAGEVIPFRGHGRISIAAKFNREFKVVAGQQVVILGN